MLRYLSLTFLALQNLRRRPYRTYALLIAVAIVSGAVFSTAILIMGVDNSLKLGLSKFGADMIVVPKGALVSMKSALLTGEASIFYMNEDIMRDAPTIKGVKNVSPQVFLTTAEGECCAIGNAFVVGFDPATDFTVMPWLEEKLDEPFGDFRAVVGGLNPYNTGDNITFYGQNLRVYGKLGKTGVGLYDNAVFITMETAYELSEKSKNNPRVVPLALDRGKISAVLIRLDVGAKPELVNFTLSKNPDVKVITAGNIITSVRQNLVALFSGTFILSVVLIVANVMMISAIFSTIINERRRELGLLRAIGARKHSIFRLIVYESAMLTALGGISGIIVGGMILRIYQRTIIFNLKALNMPYIWPSISSMLFLALIAVGLSVIVGIVGASYPALIGSKMHPYDAIRGGE
ncbi:MAG: FtsX-like permease family protein [Nitrospirota bacterium]